MQDHSKYVLRVLCKDQSGIVAKLASLVSEQGGNILSLDEHVEAETGIFAMRLVAEGFSSLSNFQKVLKKGLPFQDFQFWLDDLSVQQKVAIMVTKEPTCLYDLLMKQRIGELHCEIPLILSNRQDLKGIAEQFNIPFHYVAIEGDQKREQEKRIEALLKQHQIDLVVLARYMRILSAEFVQPRMGKLINIHHGFLPAFKGANPYRQAWERGVKIIGATAHYVTADLDEGPIIHQEVEPVTHQFAVPDLVRTGRDIERLVLFKAVQAHLDYRVLLLGRKTIVFHF